ncbi:hypothetical protein DLAC_08164 [Tieghemostelium lacteum]|uniref:Uncharacterized protein n=1 Tax=Tieghemostelium lacteum TaxID=361077 RepID=A0A151ZBC7_TIELA|nr:hypothetical protein DLAC_08164 [Tieghemostelium lacteum]|eukprot:KYQ91235.1 hypothetical protein DLAC_08164 [Tieghemostelium lacteum]
MDFNLCQSIKYGYLQNIKLFERSNLLSDRGTNGENYLHLAAESGNESIVRFLSLLISVTSKDNEGMTPLHWAALEGKTLSVSCLLSNKADPNDKDNNGETPLYLAALKGSSQCLLSLINSRGQVNLQTNNGNTPLHIAIMNQNVECVELLIEKGADYNIQNDKGITARQLWAQSTLSSNEKYTYLFYSKTELIELVKKLKLEVMTLSGTNQIGENNNQNVHQKQEQQQAIEKQYTEQQFKQIQQQKNDLINRSMKDLELKIFELIKSTKDKLIL